MKVTEIKKIAPNMFGHVCPKCGAILSSGTDPELLPEFMICPCDKNERNNRFIELTLPEFAFVEGSWHEKPNILEGRNVILHTKTLSVMEIFDRENAFIDPKILKWNFTNINESGREPMVIALHCSATLDAEKDRDFLLKHVMKPAAKWFCDYCDWEDANP